MKLFVLFKMGLKHVFLSSFYGGGFYLSFRSNMKCVENVSKHENISLSQYASNNAVIKFFKVLLFGESHGVLKLS